MKNEQAIECPFCGSTPVVDHWHFGGPQRTIVSCLHGECPVNPDCVGGTRTEAVARWNTRLGSDREIATNAYQVLLEIAKAKGWKLPENSPLPKQAWVSYWMACHEYELNPEHGRPVVPHRSA